MVKGPKHSSLVYSNTPAYNRRTFNIGVYTNNFDCIVRIICQKEIEEARKRIIVGRKGFYQYTPSKEYVKALRKFHSKKSDSDHA